MGNIAINANTLAANIVFFILVLFLFDCYFVNFEKRSCNLSVVKFKIVWAFKGKQF